MSETKPGIVDPTFKIGSEEEAITERIKDTLIRTMKSSTRSKYNKRCLEYERRYEALRSVSGLQLGPDPTAPAQMKKKPWPGCADLGVPFDMLTIQQLHPRLMRAFGLSPLFESHSISKDALKGAPDVDWHYEYQLVDRAKLGDKIDEAFLSSLKKGEAVISPVWSVKKRIVKEKRWYLIADEGGKDKILMDAFNKMIELPQEEVDFVELFWNKMVLENDKVKQTVSALVQQTQGKLSDKETILALLGFEFAKDGKSVTVIEPSPLDKSEDAKAKRRKVVYRAKQKKSNTEVVYYEGVEFEIYEAEDCYWPLDARTSDIQDLPWFAVILYPDEAWIRQRSKNNTKSASGFDPVAVEKCISAGGQKEDTAEIGKVWRVAQFFGSAALNEDEKASGQWSEVIGWYDVDADILLGWIPNFNLKNRTKYVRPLFALQPRPENGRYPGTSVPGSIAGLRDIADAVVNQFLDRGSIFNNPPMIVSARKMLNKEEYEFGPGARFLADAASFVNTLHFDKNEAQEMSKVQWLTLLVQQMWGVSELNSGLPSKNSESKTLGEIQLRGAFGSEMLGKQVTAYAKSLTAMMEYVKYLFANHAGEDAYRYAAREKIKGSDQSAKDLRMKIMTYDRFGDSLVTKIRTAATEARRQEILQSIGAYTQALTSLRYPAFQSPRFVHSLALLLRDELNLEMLDLPTLEEMKQEQGQSVVSAMKAQHQQVIARILQSVKNAELRKQLQLAYEQEMAAQGGQPLPISLIGAGANA